MSDNTSWPSSGSSWHSGSWNDKKPGEEPGSFKFESEHFFSTDSVSRSNYYCPYSLRQSQLSVPYQYDLLLVYDPEEPDYVEKLMQYLNPQNLKIFDFVRDAPPGMPQRKLLQSAFQFCRYTCIVITKQFTSSFWLQLRTDMSIQDMLDNEQKMYSVIVVVMDPDVKRNDLPLDLATLSPLFFTDRFFEHRIKRAFSKSAPFPLSFSMESSKGSNIHDLPKCNDLARNQFHLKPDLNPSTSSLLTKNSTVSESSDLRIGGRIPQEHGDGTFVMPPSIFPTSIQNSYSDPLTMHRAISVTINSTGSRQPRESAESSQNAVFSRFDSITEAKNFYRSGSVDGNDSTKTSAADPITYQESDFSSSDATDSGNFPANLSTDCDNPTFFSLGEPSFIETTASDMSDLEISTASLPIPSQTSSLNVPVNTVLQRGESLEAMEMERNRLSPDGNGDSCMSLPAKLNHENDSKKQNMQGAKKSRSMRSLVSIKLSRMSKAFKSKKT